jgi:hypothetical protein
MSYAPRTIGKSLSLGIDLGWEIESRCSKSPIVAVLKGVGWLNGAKQRVLNSQTHLLV